MTDQIEKKLARGAGVNFLGIIARSLHPLFFILITRTYGPSVFGVYLLAHILIELAIAFTLAGFKDGVLMFSSRYVGEEGEQDKMYRIMADAMKVMLSLTGVSIIVVFALGTDFFNTRFDKPDLGAALKLMVFALPFVAIPQFVVAATKALMIMKYDLILIGVLEPTLLLGAALALLPLDLGVVGLGIAYLLAHVLLTIVAVLIFRRHFSIGSVVRNLPRWGVHRPLVVFALPQNLNLALSYFTYGISVLMLGLYGYSGAQIAFFGTGAEIIRNIKQVRLAFSNAFAPVIARFWKQGRLDDLSTQYSITTRWVIFLAFPATLLVLAFKEPLLLLFHESYSQDSGFMVVLAVGALVSACLGIAANLTAMTGHSLWNLLVGIATGTVGVTLNAVLIPPLGLYGAALATAGSVLVSITLYVTLAHRLLRIRLLLKLLREPLVAGLLATVALVASYRLPIDGIARSLISAALVLGTYVGTMAILGLSEHDRALIGKLANRPGPKQLGSDSG